MPLEEILLKADARKQLRDFARNRLDGRCLYCGDKPGTITADHIIPRSKGGDLVHWNLAPACTCCQRDKGNREVWQWWKRSVHWEDAVEDGRTLILQSILDDRRSLAEFLVETLDQNPSFRLRYAG